MAAAAAEEEVKMVEGVAAEAKLEAVKLEPAGKREPAAAAAAEARTAVQQLVLEMKVTAAGAWYRS